MILVLCLLIITTINYCRMLVIISNDYLLILLNPVTNVMYHYE